MFLAFLFLVLLVISALNKYPYPPQLGFFKRTDKSRWRRHEKKQAANEDDDLLEKKVPLDDQD